MGLKMLQKMGYKGGGLGKDGSGITKAIEAKKRVAGEGLGNRPEHKQELKPEDTDEGTEGKVCPPPPPPPAPHIFHALPTLHCTPFLLSASGLPLSPPATRLCKLSCGGPFAPPRVGDGRAAGRAAGQEEEAQKGVRVESAARRRPPAPPAQGACPPDTACVRGARSRCANASAAAAAAYASAAVAGVGTS
jgi:hypothetical protein